MIMTIHNKTTQSNRWESSGAVCLVLKRRAEKQILKPTLFQFSILNQLFLGGLLLGGLQLGNDCSGPTTGGVSDGTHYSGPTP